MSQHFFNTTYQEKPVIVLIGYDRPMQGFFMVIDYSSGDEEEGYIYSNLFEEETHPNDLGNYQVKLEELGIRITDEMFKELEFDQINRIGNKTVRHSIVDGYYRRQING